MNHEEIETRLSDYRDGELPAPERAEVETHLKACADCRAALELDARAAKALFRAPTPSRAETEALVRALLPKISGAPRPSVWELLRPAFPWAAPALAFAAAAAAVFVAPRTDRDPFDSLVAAQAGSRTYSWV
ncbi:MAG TPA: zf-HC2 domain-containing protein, partial [Elusimicrobiota bacterium]|nr:zf-HC2 domain-containing protein [Elusimicrobiota bacterium]